MTDEFIVPIFPVLLENGTRWFYYGYPEYLLILVNHKRYDTGLAQLDYRKKCNKNQLINQSQPKSQVDGYLIYLLLKESIHYHHNIVLESKPGWVIYFLYLLAFLTGFGLMRCWPISGIIFNCFVTFGISYRFNKPVGIPGLSFKTVD